ncbi:peptidoglycan-binding protein LysM [Paracoccus aerodenitrificans]|uniref:peptidoglycan-binding protein LysM n=1 Tax=Paracoccus aerodenitrificans TaxID=3017781 RepID=UPI0022F126ED|nr:peptidoglycan-binding protein LysM [Paracoccus aerodenitrificans]WBU63716.1 peptidoglycan-binding protein LysM [Paracoccus aerodenitrificans]
MALWDFVKDAGKSVLGSAEAAEVKDPGPDAEKADTDRKVAAMKAELKELGLDADDVKLTLRSDKETVKIESKGADRETMEKLVVAIGNIKGIAKVEADMPEAEKTATVSSKSSEPVFHTVKSGETLSAIAKQYLGDANRYNDIFEANRPMLSDPNKIYPGQTLRIPG